jgi:LysR family transcriptional regulator, low CO2-responsive transcriptional regulator
VPFLRHQLIAVVAPDSPLAAAGRVTPETLARHPWLLGPFAIEPATPEGAFVARNRLQPRSLRAFPSHAAALGAAIAGEGVLPALAHLVREELRRGLLVRLDVPGTPQQGLWYAAMLRPGNRPPVASELRRFVATPEATQAILSGTPGVPAERFRPAVHVTIWS